MDRASTPAVRAADQIPSGRADGHGTDAGATSLNDLTSDPATSDQDASATGPPGVPRWRPLVAEFVGTLILLAAVIGSGIMAVRLTEDVGLQLLANAFATIAALAVIIATLIHVSGAHFNPAVSLALALRGDLPWRALPAYLLAQLAGAVAGAVLANVMFDLPAIQISAKDRGGLGQFVGEIVATAGLLMIVGYVSRHGRWAWAPALIPAWILGAYWFTSSTSFANPAVTVARMFSDTFAGIAPAHVPGFLLAQLLAVAVGLALMDLVSGRHLP